MCVNNLPKVVIWQRLGRELNSRPVELQANALTISQPGHTANAFTIMVMKEIGYPTAFHAVEDYKFLPLISKHKNCS